MMEMSCIRRQGIPECGGVLIVEALARFLFKFMRPRLGGAGQIYTVQGETVHPDRASFELCNRAGHVDGTAAKAVDFCEDQHIAMLHLVKQTCELMVLRNGDGTGYRLGKNAMRLGPEPRGLNYCNPVLGFLTGG